jgi:hypothetical protein
MQIIQMNVLKTDYLAHGYAVSLNYERQHRDGLKSDALLSPDTESFMTIFRLNEMLNNLQIPLEVDETTIDQKLAVLERSGNKSTPAYWLLTARLAELAVFMAGYYADSCRFSAAGDLLVNPRKILVQLDGHNVPVVKSRHDNLSSQFNHENRSKTVFMQWFRKNASLNVVEKPLLPYLYDQLDDSGKIAGNYLRKLRQRMNKISDTIGFMAAWGCTTPEDLFQRLLHGSPKTREFVAANQCNFSTALFRHLGMVIQKIESALIADTLCVDLAKSNNYHNSMSLAESNFSLDPINQGGQPYDQKNIECQRSQPDGNCAGG